jgi:hypothetical protein
MTLIKKLGVQWPRNDDNLNDLEDAIGHRSGVYLLYHGAMPVYIGRGILLKRIRSHDGQRSRKTKYWDRFSWFVVDSNTKEKELESLLLQCLPFYIRVLNKQTAKFPQKLRVRHENHEVPDISLPKLPPLRRTHRRGAI